MMMKKKLGIVLGLVGDIGVFVFVGGDSGIVWCPWGLAIATIVAMGAFFLLLSSG